MASSKESCWIWLCATLVGGGRVSVNIHTTCSTPFTTHSVVLMICRKHETRNPLVWKTVLICVTHCLYRPNEAQHNICLTFNPWWPHLYHVGVQSCWLFLQEILTFNFINSSISCKCSYLNFNPGQREISCGQQVWSSNKENHFFLSRTLNLSTYHFQNCKLLFSAWTGETQEIV